MALVAVAVCCLACFAVAVEAFEAHAVDSDRVAVGLDVLAVAAGFDRVVGLAVFPVAVRVGVTVPFWVLDHVAELDLLLG
jgi:hypothetical protein